MRNIFTWKGIYIIDWVGRTLGGSVQIPGMGKRGDRWS